MPPPFTQESHAGPQSLAHQEPEGSSIRPEGDNERAHKNPGGHHPAAGHPLIAGCSDKADDFSGFIFPPPQGPPQAANDAYTGLGNSPLNVITAAQGVSANDPVPAPVTQFQNPSAQGGAVNVNADGALAYTPPAGFVGQDTFTYTATNAAGQSQATVTVTLNNQAFYVNNQAAGGGNGTFAAPSAAGPGNIVFVFRGNGTNVGLAGAVALQNGQQLIGEGAGLNFNNGINPRAEGVLAQQIVPPGQFPVLTGPITLADGNTVAGVRLEGAAGDAVTGNGINGVTLTGNQIANPTGDGVSLVNATGTLTLSNSTISGAGALGVDIDLASVNATLVAQANQVANTANQGIDLETTGNSQVSATFAGNTTTSTGVNGGGIQLVLRNTSVVNTTITGNSVNGTQIRAPASGSFPSTAAN